MASYVRTEVTTKRIRYELQLPTNAAELDKAMSAAARSFHDVNNRPANYDDDLIVTAEDELLVVSFEVIA